jgi:alpha-ketoglutarate-dependent taurine dioxygenase
MMLGQLPETMTMSCNLARESEYAKWRAEKLHRAPKSSAQITVELKNPFAITPSEKKALLLHAYRHNMVFYWSSDTTANRQIPVAVAAQMGMSDIHKNWLAEDDGISSIAVSASSENLPRSDYIPFTNKSLNWHTDGYYYPPSQRILGMALHCVRPAQHGGGSALIDPDLVYGAVRDTNPEWIQALESNDAMRIPARESEAEGGRSEQTGPVFFYRSDGLPQMRFTSRTKSIKWGDHPALPEAVEFIKSFLALEESQAITTTLEPGMGVITNNVLHRREEFRDDPTAPRLVYRVRYLDLIGSKLATPNAVASVTEEWATN